MSKVEQEHMVSAARFELGKCDDTGVQQLFINNMALIDKDFCLKIAEGFGGLKTPTEFKENKGQKSAYLSQVEGKNQGEDLYTDL